MIELTEEQRQILGDTEPIVIDPQSHEECTRARKVYHKLKGLLDDDVRLMYPMLADLDPEDWEDAANYEDTLHKKIGNLSAAVMLQINDCLKEVLELP